MRLRSLILSRLWIAIPTGSFAARQSRVSQPWAVAVSSLVARFSLSGRSGHRLHLSLILALLLLFHHNSPSHRLHLRRRGCVLRCSWCWLLLWLVSCFSSPVLAILFYLAYHGNETPVVDSVEIMDCYTNGQLCCSAVQGVATLGCSGV